MRSSAVRGSSKRRPMRRLTAKTVLSGLVTACRLAGWPTRRSSSVKATIEGVVRAPSAFSMTRGWLPSMMATQELVVPRSMPITLAMCVSFRIGDVWRGALTAPGADPKPVKGFANPRPATRPI